MKKSRQLMMVFGFAGLVAAQTPAVNTNGIVNVASFALAGQPNGAIAPGSMVVIFGANMGPATLQQAASYPLPISLGGTSIRITSGTTVTDALINYTSAGQIAAIIPSSTPVGAATAVVTYNGKASAAASFKIVANSFGIFAVNQAGSGPGIIANAASQVFGLTTAANPGEPAVIWGTGLGAVKGNEAAGPLPGDLPLVPVEVSVGGQPATVSYRGRSGCCAGIDQITFTVPGVTGCHVPVTLKINDVVSNYASMAIAPVGTRTCSDPAGPSAADLQRFSANGASVGRITLTRIGTQILVKPVSVISTYDAATATFFKYSSAQLNTAQNPFNVPNVGSCSVTTLSGLSATTQTYPDSFPAEPVVPVSLDAGANISVVGTGGTKTLLKGRDSVHPTGSPAYYSGYLSATGTLPGYLESGTITISGTGGKDVGAFQTTVDVPPALKWTNRDSITTVNRSAGQLFTWTGGDPAGTVEISGTSISPGSITNLSGATFNCIAKVSDGQFTVPPATLLSLPVNAANGTFQYGRLQVGTNTAFRSFTASGLDFAYVFATLDGEELVDYR